MTATTPDINEIFNSMCEGLEGMFSLDDYRDNLQTQSLYYYLGNTTVPGFSDAEKKMKTIFESQARSAAREIREIYEKLLIIEEKVREGSENALKLHATVSNSMLSIAWTAHAYAGYEEDGSVLDFFKNEDPDSVIISMRFIQAWMDEFLESE